MNDSSAEAVAAFGSVVIPAHNEAAVIRRCLDSLLSGFRIGEIDVIVACNGCVDDTAAIARSHRNDVTVLELDVASKTQALRSAERLTESFPRIYLDADVILPSSSARLMLDHLRDGHALAARPPIAYATRWSPAIVRAYYRARERVPSVMGSLWGAGVYGLSEHGRERFGAFPEVTGEDLYVDQQFSKDEIEVLDCDPVVVSVPRTTRDLLRILSRVYRGNGENRSCLPKTGRTDTSVSTARDLARLASSGLRPAVDAAVYAALALCGRLRASSAAARAWERDESSRAQQRR